QQPEERFPHKPQRSGPPPPQVHHHRVRLQAPCQRLVGHGTPRQLLWRLDVRSGAVSGYRIRHPDDLLLLRLLPCAAAPPQLPRRVQVSRQVQEGLGQVLRAGPLHVHPLLDM
ncbi:hypothetical protein GGI11_008871, partial [Coemansia sp. RSA 2049]